MEGNELDVAHLPIDIQMGNPGLSKDSTANSTLAEAEKHHIRKVLESTGGNKTKTADLLGIALTTLYRKMEEYHI